MNAKPKSTAPSPSGKSTRQTERSKQVGHHPGGGGPAATTPHGSPKGMSPTYGGSRPKHPSKMVKNGTD